MRQDLHKHYQDKNFDLSNVRPKKSYSDIEPAIEEGHKKRKIRSKKVARKFRHILKYISLSIKITTLLIIFFFIIKAYFHFEHLITIDNIKNKFYEKSGDLGLKLNDIIIEGNNKTSIKEIKEITNPEIGKPIFLIDITSLKKKIEKLPWVKIAVVDRQLPSTLYIAIIERKPIAIMQKNKSIFLVDDTSNIIKTDNMSDFLHLPIFVGEDVEEYIPYMLAILRKNANIFPHIEYIIRISERRWNIRLDNKLEIKMPEENFEQTYDLLTSLEYKNILFSGEFSTIDLRIAGKIYMEKK